MYVNDIFLKHENAEPTLCTRITCFSFNVIFSESSFLSFVSPKLFHLFSDRHKATYPCR